MLSSVGGILKHAAGAQQPKHNLQFSALLRTLSLRSVPRLQLARMWVILLRRVLITDQGVERRESSQWEGAAAHNQDHEPPGPRQNHRQRMGAIVL